MIFFARGQKLLLLLMSRDLKLNSHKLHKNSLALALGLALLLPPLINPPLHLLLPIRMDPLRRIRLI